MSSFSDAYKEMQHADFLRRWVPDDEWEQMDPSHETVRWYLARARAAEAELKDIHQTLGHLRTIMGGIRGYR